MNTYIALLRGINVSGKNKLRMKDLQQIMAQNGFICLRTYIQSGNMVFQHPEDCTGTLASIIRSLIYERFGYEVDVWVRKRSDFKRIVDLNPYSKTNDDATSKLYFVFLCDKPSADFIGKLNSRQFQNEEFHIYPHCIFLLCHAGYGRARCNNNFFEKHLKVRATTRNLKTVETLLDLSLKPD